MVAPTGVSGEIHHEPADAEMAPADLLEEGAQGAGRPEDGTEEAGAGLVSELTEAELTEAAQAEAAGLAEVELSEAEHAEAEQAEAEQAEAEQAEAREGRDVSPLAVAAIILIVIVLVAAAAGVLAVATHGFHKKTLVTYRPAAVFKLRPGDCINSAPNGLVVTVLACGTPHQAEVFATFSLPASSWPGDATVEQDAGDGCASRLGAYLNPDLANAGLAQEFVYPNQAAWQAGERTVVCEVSSATGKLTGSVRNGS
jgi:Septum formation